MKKETGNFLLTLYDIDRFLDIVKTMDSSEIFDLINRIQNRTIKILAPLNPLVIKNIGDANLIVTNKENIDKTISIIIKLKQELEDELSKIAKTLAVSFYCHYGLVSLGQIGTGKYAAIDVFGSPVNELFLKSSRINNGKFLISPEVHSLLSSDTMSLFNKSKDNYCLKEK